MNDYYQLLLDEYACRRLQERYWRALSEHDADGISAVFTADGRWGSAKGRDAILEAARSLFLSLDALEFMSTHVGSIRIEVNGDKATGAIEGIAHHVVRGDREPRIVVANALYYLDYVKTKNGWLISSMTGKLNPSDLHDAAFQFNVPMAAIDYGLPPQD